MLCLLLSCASSGEATAWVDPTDQDGDGWHGATDCDDTDPAIHPGATVTWYDGIDQDCGGGSDFDADQDGWDSSGIDEDCDPDTPDTDTPVTGCAFSCRVPADGEVTGSMVRLAWMPDLGDGLLMVNGQGLPASWGELQPVEPRDALHRGRSLIGHPGRHQPSTQFSTFKPATRSNSRVLLVTTVRPSANACAAMSMSRLPMGVPARSSRARTTP